MDRLMGSKALAAEVRILLQEVGKLRDEKRALQYEVSELLAAKVSLIYHYYSHFLLILRKARYGSDGDYNPEWYVHPKPQNLGRYLPIKSFSRRPPVRNKIWRNTFLTGF